MYNKQINTLWCCKFLYSGHQHHKLRQLVYHHQNGITSITTDRQASDKIHCHDIPSFIRNLNRLQQPIWCLSGWLVPLANITSLDVFAYCLSKVWPPVTTSLDEIYSLFLSKMSSSRGVMIQSNNIPLHYFRHN